jgi:hypothetical protein
MKPLQPPSHCNASRDRSWAWPGHDGARLGTAGSEPKSPANPLLSIDYDCHRAASAPPRLPKQPPVHLRPALAATGALFKSP